MFAEKLAGQFYKRFPETLKNTQNFRVELKTSFLKSFQGSRTQFQSQIFVTNIRHVMDRACMLQLIFINLSGRISRESFDVTK